MYFYTLHYRLPTRQYRVYTLQYTSYILQYRLYTLHYRMYSIQSRFYSLQYRLKLYTTNVDCPLCKTGFTYYNTKCTPSIIDRTIYTSYVTLDTIGWTFYDTDCPLYNKVFFTWHYSLYISHYTNPTLQYILCTLLYIW